MGIAVRVRPSATIDESAALVGAKNRKSRRQWNISVAARAEVGGDSVTP